jgi:hypothetical protein
MRFHLIEPAALERLLAGWTIEARFGDYDRSPFDPAGSPFLILGCR